MAMATREKKRGGTEESKSIFAGLNFPEVPTTLIHPPSSYAKLQTLEEDIEEEEKTEITNEPIVTSAATTTTPPPSAKSLASLYSTGSEVQIAAGEYCYPDLPISIVSMNLPAMNNMTPQRGATTDEDETIDNEKTSLLTSTVTASVSPYALSSTSNAPSSQVLSE